MIGNRLKKANLIAKKRSRREFWHSPEPGSLRKNNTVCSCEMCCNPRHCGWSSGKEKLTVQERRSPTVEDFNLQEEDNSQFYYDPEVDWEEEYLADMEYFMLEEYLEEE